jgi:hypothetical protein
VEQTADDALSGGRGSRGAGEEVDRPRDRAKAFLRRLLRDGAMLAADVEAAAMAEGIKLDTLKNAKADLGVRSRKRDGRGGAWLWFLPGREEELPF